jgi:hypothetical protein
MTNDGVSPPRARRTAARRRRYSSRSALVHLAPVRNAGDTDDLLGVVNGIDDAPVADPNAPMVFVAFKRVASLNWCLIERGLVSEKDPHSEKH